ncbi:MAG: hypothetical protein ABEJ87_05620 [Candidatus Nanohalobium sp.]
MKGFEVEYFTDFSTGPRYTVDVATGEVLRDDVFMHGEGPIANSGNQYPGEPNTVIDLDAAEEAYDQITGSGLEPGDFHVHRNSDRDFRVEVYGEGSREVKDVDEDVVYDAVEELEDLF